jgi:hypothetical protein
MFLADKGLAVTFFLSLLKVFCFVFANTKNNPHLNSEPGARQQDAAATRRHDAAIPRPVPSTRARGEADTSWQAPPQTSEEESKLHFATATYPMMNPPLGGATIRLVVYVTASSPRGSVTVNISVLRVIPL